MVQHVSLFGAEPLHCRAILIPGRNIVARMTSSVIDLLYSLSVWQATHVLNALYRRQRLVFKMAGVSTVFVALLAASQVSARNTRNLLVTRCAAVHHTYVHTGCFQDLLMCGSVIQLNAMQP